MECHLYCLAVLPCHSYTSNISPATTNNLSAEEPDCMFSELFISLQSSATSLGSNSHGLWANMKGAEINSYLAPHKLWLFSLFIAGSFHRITEW